MKNAGINDPEMTLRGLYERYASIVHSRCRMILRSEEDAWDATQEIFMKLHHSLDTIAKKESIFSWLMSVSTNHCISMLRKRRGERFDEQMHGIKDVPPQEKELLSREILDKLLGHWDQKTRMVIVYAYIDGYRQEEIAKLTGMGESTIRKYLTRFKRESVAGASLIKEGAYE